LSHHDRQLMAEMDREIDKLHRQLEHLEGERDALRALNLEHARTLETARAEFTALEAKLVELQNQMLAAMAPCAKQWGGGLLGRSHVCMLPAGHASPCRCGCGSHPAGLTVGGEA
jgi:myo-inositol catabolism protein IolC